MLLFSRLIIIILVFSLGFMAFLFTSSRRVSFCFSYPLVTMIPTSCESAESKLMMVFDTVMAELFLPFFSFLNHYDFEIDLARRDGSREKVIVERVTRFT